MTGKDLLAAVVAGSVPQRWPYVPLIGRIACRLGQVGEEDFVGNPQVQATALAQTAAALGADAVTVGLRTHPTLGAAVVERIRPLLAGRGVVACLAEPDVSAARSYGEAGVDMIFLVEPDLSGSRVRSFCNVCRFYRIPVIIADARLEDPARVAEELRFQGAIVASPTDDDPGIVGGGLSATKLADTPPAVPRRIRFFWSFPVEVDEGTSPEALVRLGRALASVK